MYLAKDIFHYLPVSWYRHPIPNDLREFWYKERPDILEYMQKAYKDLDIQFLPENILRKVNESGDLAIPQKNLSNLISTEILSKGNLFEYNQFIHDINSMSGNLHNF